MTKAAEKGINLNLVVILSILYAIISILVDGLSFIPQFDTDAEFRLGIFMPGLTAVVFGPMLGGLSAGFGNLIIDLYHVYTGDRIFGFELILGSIVNFIGAYITGLLSVKTRKNFSSVFDYLKNIKSWLNIIQNTIASIIGLGMITGLGIGYGILYYYLEMPVEVAASVAFNIFFYNTLVLIFLIPIALSIHHIVRIKAANKVKRLDIIHRDLNIKYDNKKIEISKIWLPHHSFYRNQYTEISLEFINTLNQAKQFIVELVSYSNSHNQIKTTAVVNPTNTAIVSFYVFVHRNQKNVNLQFMVTPSEKNVFKKTDDRRARAKITAVSLRKSGDKLSEFSITNVIIIAISILWSNIMSYDLSAIKDSYTLLLLVLFVEIVLFIPFVYFRYRKHKKRTQEISEFEISFSSDLETHEYDEYIEDKKSKINRNIRNLINPILSLLVFISLLMVTYDIYYQYIIFETTSISEYLDILLLILIILSIVRFWILDTVPEETEVEFEHGESDFVKGFRAFTEFKINQKSIVEIEVKSPYKKGVRLSFQSVDTISPEFIDLHGTAEELSKCRIAITPEQTGPRELLVLASPLFDESGKYIHQASEIIFQKINFNALGETALGLTEDQYDKLKQLASYGGVATAAIISLNELVNLGIENLIAMIRDLLPVLLLLQIPFIYTYFYIRNKFSRIMKL